MEPDRVDQEARAFEMCALQTPAHVNHGDIHHDESQPQDTNPRPQNEPSDQINLGTSSQLNESVGLLSSSTGHLTPRSECTRYADQRLLSRFIPGADPDHPDTETFRLRLSKRATMLRMQLLLALVTTVVNIGFTAWAYSIDAPTNGVGTILQGDCVWMARVNSAAHIVLNALSSLFLGAGNYCMQVLVAPSPAEVRGAHRRGTSYDIGTQSVRNILRIRRISKKLLWLGIGLCSTLLHLIWNSALFPSIPFVQFPVALVTDDFILSADDWTISRPVTHSDDEDDISMTIYELHDRASNFEKHNNSQCMSMFTDPLLATAELVLVTNETSTDHNGTSLLNGWVSGANPPRWDASTGWICAGHNDEKWTRYCSLEWAHSFQNDWIFFIQIESTKHPVIVHYCLVGEPASDITYRCGFHYNFNLLILIIAFTAVDTILVCCVAAAHADHTLVVFGDAVAEALRTREDGDYLSQSDARPPDPTQAAEPAAMLQKGKWPEGGSPRWFSAVSSKNWTWALALLVAGVITGAALFGFSVAHLRRARVSITLASLWSQGLGKTSAYSLLGGLLASSGSLNNAARVGHVVFANAFQVMVSFLYLFYNNVLTRQVVANEMIGYLRHKKALRVSTPQNQIQRSSHFLSLPWKYSAPQMVAFATLHWLVSQSVFTVQTTAYGAGPAGQRTRSVDTSRVGFSSIGILLSTCLGLILIIFLLANSCRRYSSVVPTWFPSMATDSAGIWANCSRPLPDQFAHLYPIRLGVTIHDLPLECPGRVTFSSDADLQRPEGGGSYEFAHWRDTINNRHKKRAQTG